MNQEKVKRGMGILRHRLLDDDAIAENLWNRVGGAQGRERLILPEAKMIYMIYSQAKGEKREEDNNELYKVP